MNSPRRNDNCEALAPFVMALFDGEADELEAKRARAHLLVCQRCAHRWLDWNRSRDLLRTVPVPAPPPTLLWRVLMACRLAAFAQNGRSTSADSAKTAAGFAPKDLSDHILARTTRAETPATLRSARRSVSFFALPSLAVPALAIWMLALQNNSFLTAPPENPVSTVSTRTAPRVTKVAALPKVVVASRTVRAKPKLVMNSAAPLETATPPREIAPREIKRVAEENPEPRPIRETSPAAPRGADSREVVEAAVPVSLAVPVLASSPPAPTTRPRVAPVMASVAPPAVAAPSRRSQAQLVLAVATKPARLSSSSTTRDAPSLRTARWKIATPPGEIGAGKTSPETLPSRVAAPSAPVRIASVAPAPRLVESVPVDDAQVEEMHSVVQDFRAALAPDGFQTIDFETESR